MKYQTAQRELRVKIIRTIASELRNDRNRDAAYSMKVARRYTSMFFSQVKEQYS